MCSSSPRGHLRKRSFELSGLRSCQSCAASSTPRISSPSSRRCRILHSRRKSADLRSGSTPCRSACTVCRVKYLWLDGSSRQIVSILKMHVALSRGRAEEKHGSPWRHRRCFSKRSMPRQNPLPATSHLCGFHEEVTQMQVVCSAIASSDTFLPIKFSGT